ncbi:MAG: hypothetical protein L6Q66_06430 [Bacteroidia bacterium]|nr:hypothetical protein [Bacteroidia bacterium]
MSGQSLNNIEILHKSLGANGPSMGLGVPTMVIGITTILVGLGNKAFLAIIIGFALLLIAALLIFSIECIAINKNEKQLYLYKDYYVAKKGDWILWTKYSAVCIYYKIDRPRNNRGSLNRTQFKTFEVYLTSNKGDKLLIKEFGNIEPAKQLQYILAKNTRLELIAKPIREV